MPFAIVVSICKRINKTEYKSALEMDFGCEDFQILLKRLSLVEHNNKFYTKLEANQVLDQLNFLAYETILFAKLFRVRDVWCVHKKPENDRKLISPSYVIVKYDCKLGNVNVEFDSNFDMVHLRMKLNTVSLVF